MHDYNEKSSDEAHTAHTCVIALKSCCCCICYWEMENTLDWHAEWKWIWNTMHSHLVKCKHMRRTRKQTGNQGRRKRKAKRDREQVDVALLVQMKNDRCKITLTRCHPIALNAILTKHKEYAFAFNIHDTLHILIVCAKHFISLMVMHYWAWRFNDNVSNFEPPHGTEKNVTRRVWKREEERVKQNVHSIAAAKPWHGW